MQEIILAPLTHEDLGRLIAGALHSELALRRTRRTRSEDPRLVDANIIGIYIGNLEGEIIEANEAFLAIC